MSRLLELENQCDKVLSRVARNACAGQREARDLLLLAVFPNPEILQCQIALEVTFPIDHYGVYQHFLCTGAKQGVLTCRAGGGAGK